MNTERFIGTVAAHCGHYTVHVAGKQAIIRGAGVEWRHDIAHWAPALRNPRATLLSQQVANLLALEFGPAT